MNNLQYYKNKLNLTNDELKHAFDVSSTTVAKWLIDGAPLSVLKQLKDAEVYIERG